MGVGAIHVGYANHFFPGTSVLQRRPRYLFFTCWNYLCLDRLELGWKNGDILLSQTISRVLCRTSGSRDEKLVQSATSQPPQNAERAQGAKERGHSA
jgi:hypothetical protein